MIMLFLLFTCASAIRFGDVEKIKPINCTQISRNLTIDCCDTIKYVDCTDGVCDVEYDSLNCKLHKPNVVCTDDCIVNIVIEQREPASAFVVICCILITVAIAIMCPEFAVGMYLGSCFSDKSERHYDC